MTSQNPKNNLGAQLRALGLKATAESIDDFLARAIKSQWPPHLILEEVLRQVFGEGESKRRTLKWDPQFRRALEATPSAERLLRDPQGFIAVRAAEARQAAPANNP